MEEATALPGGDEIVTDQVLYNMRHRGIEWDLLPWCRERGIPIMAYSPIEHSPREQQGMLDHPRLRLVAPPDTMRLRLKCPGVAASTEGHYRHPKSEPDDTRTGEPHGSGSQAYQRESYGA
jgi:hypothetical protein